MLILTAAVVITAGIGVFQNIGSRAQPPVEPVSTTRATPITTDRPAEHAPALPFTATSDGSFYGEEIERSEATGADLAVDGEPRIGAVVAFSPSGIDAPIASARLRLYALTAVAGPLRVYTVGTDWDEGGLNFRTRPDRLTPDYSESTTAQEGSWIEIDVTSFVSTAGPVAFEIEQPSATLVRLSAREGVHPPELLINLAINSNSPPTVIQGDLVVSTSDHDFRPSATDPDGDALICGMRRHPLNGTADMLEDCTSASYRPHPGAVGEDRLDFVVFDGTYSVTVEVRIVIPTPIGIPVVPTVIAYRSGSEQEVVITLRGHDPDGRCPLRFEVVESPAVGSLGDVVATTCWQGHATGSITLSPPSDNSDVTFAVAAVDADGLRSAPGQVISKAAAASPFLIVSPIHDGTVPSGRLGAAATIGDRLRIDADPPSTAFLLFDLRGLFNRADTADLRVYAESSSFEGINVHMAAADWTEDDLAGGRSPSFDLVPLAMSGPVWDGQWVRIPIPADLISADFVAFALTTDGSRAVSLAARESERPPVLVIEHKPEAAIDTIER